MRKIQRHVQEPFLVQRPREWNGAMSKKQWLADSYASRERLLCRLNSAETYIVQVVNISLGQPPAFFPTALP